MKYRVFSSPTIMAYCLLWNLPLVLVVSLVSLFSSNLLILPFILNLLPVEFLIIWNYLNAFCLVRIDEEGLHTKKCSLRWEDIDRFQLYRIDGSAYRRMECFGFPPILGLGDPQEGRFEKQDNTRVILLTPTRKTMEKIRRCCKNPNKTVQQLIVRYSILAK